MSSSTLAGMFLAAFHCAAREPSVCKELPFYKEHDGQRYCVLHYPGKEKLVAFWEALIRKLNAKDYNFRGVWFPNSPFFRDFTFSTPVIFAWATFSEGADFRRTTFSGEANFTCAEFNADAMFDIATFSAEARFEGARFGAEASFEEARFGGEVEFQDATFSGRANFSFATFKDYVRFSGREKRPVFDNGSTLFLQFVRTEKPDSLSFYTLALRPQWFVNADARKFEFINVDWNWRDISTKEEIKSLERKKVSSPHPLLATACRNLATNAEENHRYEEASRFRYMAMDARRLERWRGWAFWTLGWWYWLASGYGERVWRAFVVLNCVWLVAAALYTRVGFARWEPRVSTQQEAAEARRDEVGEPLKLPRALTYSLGVMTLQKPEPRPATNAAQSLVMLETILGPVQAALLALAIRRKFMR